MNPEELGRQALKRRKELKLSQEALAEQAEISRNYLGQIERGEARNLTMKVLDRLAGALGTTPGRLMGQAGVSEILIPPTLREFGIEEGLSFEIVDRLSRIPRRGQEPRTVGGWRRLYDAVRQYIEEAD